ncbi:MAG: PTS sugar transporter subunit IIA [Candidatus Aminicenantes bacterium]|nr:PTS sugar transporter subunit IIA [Candidatus Aminicenantes bacterium]
MQVIDITNESICLVNLEVRDKKKLLLDISTKLAGKFENLSAEEIFNALMEREKLGSTGFGEGLAIPHAKFDNIESFGLCIVTLKKGMDFGSIDKKKVKIVIAIIGPSAQQEEYLRLLAKVSKIIRHKNILSEMKKSPSESALKEAFIKGTISLEDDKKDKTKKVNRLLIINLKESKYFDDIINLLLEKGISNAVVTDSLSIENYLTDSPLFSGFLNFLAERSGGCRTIMAAVNNKEVMPLVDDIENIMGDLNTHTGIQVMALEIGFIRGAIAS